MTHVPIPPKGHYVHTIINSTSYQSIADAIAEFIDNSFAPNKGNADAIYIEYDKTKDRWVIVDNGRGVDDVTRLARLGDTTSWNDDTDVGGFGQGATAASIYLADVLEVISLREEGAEWGIVNWEEQLKCDTMQMEVRKTKRQVLRCPEFETETGLYIKLSRLRHSRVRSRDAALATLRHRYAPALRAGKRIVIKWSTQQPEILTPPPKVRLDDEIMLTGEVDGCKFTGRAGLMPEVIRKLNKTWIYFQADRIVDEMESEVWHDMRSTRFYAEVVLEPSWKQHLNPSKTRLANLREELAEEISDQCRHILEKAAKQAEEIEIDRCLMSLQMMCEDVTCISTTGVATGGGHGIGETKDPAGGGGDEGSPNYGVEDETAPGAVLISDDGGKTKRKPKNAIQLIKRTDKEMRGRMIETDYADGKFQVVVNTDDEGIKPHMHDPWNTGAMRMAIAASVASCVEANDLHHLIKGVDWDGSEPPKNSPSDKNSRYCLMQKKIYDGIGARSVQQD